MAARFEDIVNGMINVSFGAAAIAAEKGKAALDELSAKGAEVRKDPSAPDFARSVSDAFAQAGGTISDVTERLSSQGETAAEKVLDELILLRARQLSEPDREEFVKHVEELVKHADDDATPAQGVKVEVEDAPEDVDPDTDAASDADSGEAGK